MVGSASGGSGASGGTGAAGAASTGTTSTATSTGTVTIQSTGRYVVSATVASSDVEQLKEGLQAEITPTGVTDTVYGTVTSVGLVAQTSSSGAAVFPVTIAVTGNRKDLYAGTSADASIIVKQIADVLTVPSRALKTSGGTTYVMKVVDGKSVRTTVITGTTYGMSTEVTKGSRRATSSRSRLHRRTRPRRQCTGSQQGEMPDFGDMQMPPAARPQAVRDRAERRQRARSSTSSASARPTVRQHRVRGAARRRPADRAGRVRRRSWGRRARASRR